MGWMNRWQKRGSDQPKQLPRFAEQQLENEFYAVIRVTWSEGSLRSGWRRNRRTASTTA